MNDETIKSYGFSESKVHKICEDNKIRTFLSWDKKTGKMLGWGLSDEDYPMLIQLLKKYTITEGG